VPSPERFWRTKIDHATANTLSPLLSVRALAIYTSKVLLF
jgi:hypothetical protein